MSDVLSQKELKAMDAYWRAANYLSVGQIYLLRGGKILAPQANSSRDRSR